MPADAHANDSRPERINWAGNVRYQSHSLEKPGDSSELAKLLIASLNTKALGTRHSFNQIADTNSLHISLERLDRMGPVDTQSKSVAVEAGVRYGELGRFLHERGFALRNLASLPHISVVGACATATHGSGVGNGCLATEVNAIELVDGRGERVRLSRKDDADVFSGAVVHLGALGVVTQIHLDLVPAYQFAQTVYENLPLEVFETQTENVFSAAYSVSLFANWRQEGFHQVWVKRRLEAEEDAPSQAADFFGARAAREKRHPLHGHARPNCTEQLGRPGPWHERLPHFRLEFTPSSGEELQSEYLIPRRYAWPALKSLFELRARIQPLIHVSEFRTVAADDFWLSPFYKRDALAIHFTWKPMPPEVERLLPDIEAALAPFQPRPHWGKCFAMKLETLGSLYPRFDDFARLVERFDAKGKFRNPFLDRLLR